MKVTTKTPSKMPIQHDQYLAIEQLNGGFNVKNRIIYIDENVDIYSPIYLQERVHLISDMSNDYITPITLQISCYGGDSHGMFGMIDLMSTFPMKINTFAVGAALSAAAILLTCGTGVRSATENTTIMVHNFQLQSAGDSGMVRRDMDFIDKLEEKMFNILGAKSTQPAEFWIENCKQSFYLTASKALEYGLIDEINYGKTEKTKTRSKASRKSA